MTTMEAKRALEQNHRLHYRWSQLEADRCGVNIGSPIRPLPSANRTLELDPNRKYNDGDWPLMSNECPEALAKFSACAGVYKTIDYNTFAKNSALKLSEVELYFLASKVKRDTAKDWALVHLGIGTCERFRWLRDECFPGLTVIAFDGLEGFSNDEEEIAKAAEKWNNDGSDFTYLMRCFDLEKDCEWIQEKLQGKKMLLITDVRGIAYLNGDSVCGTESDRSADMFLQWEAVKRLRPERSLIKFACPSAWNQEYEYAPGVLLKLVYTYYGTRELRLMIDGVPEQRRRYNVWELYAKMMFHHEHLRGQVYKASRRSDSSRCLDCSWDSTVLWDTISSYARNNELDADKVLKEFIKYHVYCPESENWREFAWRPPTKKQRIEDVVEFLKKGKLMEAIAALEAEGEEENEDTDWSSIVQNLHQAQPMLAQRLKICLHQPASRSTLIQALGSLSDPFTLIGTDLNNLHPVEDKEEEEEPAEPPAKRQCVVNEVWKNEFVQLNENQQKAALALGWTEATWNSNHFHLPRKTPWDQLSQEMRDSLSALGENADTWNNWKK